MCGINGIFAYGDSAPPVEEAELLRTREHMVKRGPDGAGLWISPDRKVGLAHRRLAIIDLSDAGAQPMATADGRIRITFNGEIYNYREIRRELEGRGYVFRTQSDTEVLLHLYAERGEDMVHALRGMYAFALWDEHRKGVFLARDPFGIKPLYYADDGRTLRFASQVKALLKGGSVDTTPSAPGHVGFFLWGCVPEPHTLFKGVRALPAGSCMRVEARGERQPKVFFKVSEEFARADARLRDLSPQAQHDHLHAALTDSVRHHFVADVPVGVFLSSGLDSTTLAALSTEVGAGELHTITLGFEEYRGTQDDETPLAALVAQRYGTLHRTQWVSRSDFADNLDHLLEAMDQPTTDGVNTYFVSRAAAKAGMKVALSGTGGDELFGGYPSFRDVPRIAEWLGPMRRFPRLGSGFRRVCAPLLKHLTSPKYAGLLEYGGSYSGGYLLRRGLYMPWELPEFLDMELVREGWQELHTLLRLEETVGAIRSSYQRVSALELSWYMRNQLLRDSDWAGMAHSLEIRVPLVDVALFRAVAPLLAADRPLKQAQARAPARQLPDRVIQRRKTGFSIPVRDWLRLAGSGPRGLRGWAHRTNPAARKRRRMLALVTDAFGGHGGIAKFNRDFLGALCSHADCGEVIAIPRLLPSPPGPLPARLTYLIDAVDSKLKYVLKLLVVLAGPGRFDLVICGHINLVPIAWLASVISRCRLVLVVHGIDAWQPTPNIIANLLVRRIDAFISVSALTRERFTAWTGLGRERGFLLPNSIDLEAFRPGPKNEALLQKYALRDKVLIMTMGRLVSAERYKGFDEVLDALPALLVDIPNLAYMIAGEGDDRGRLLEKAARLGVREHVVFTGFVPEDSKHEYYNLADAFIMPSRGEGFGIVLLEAMACGVPTVASKIDGGREALIDGRLGTLVDPENRQEICAATLAALRSPRMRPAGLEHFSQENFTRRAQELISEVIARPVASQ